MEFWQRRRRQYLAFLISLFINSVSVFFLFVEFYLSEDQQKKEAQPRQQQKTVYPRLGSPQGQQKQQQKTAPVIFQLKAPAQPPGTQKLDTQDEKQKKQEVVDQKDTHTQQPARSPQREQKTELKKQSSDSEQKKASESSDKQKQSSEKKQKQQVRRTQGYIKQLKEQPPDKQPNEGKKQETAHDEKQHQSATETDTSTKQKRRPTKNPRAKFFKNPEKLNSTKKHVQTDTSPQQPTQTGGIPRPRHIPQSQGSLYGSQAEKKAMQFEHETFYSKCAQAIVRSSRELRHDVTLPPHVKRTVRVRFGITRARKNVDVEIITSSGHIDIDKAVTAIITNALMPQIPNDITGDMLYHTISIDIKTPSGTSHINRKQPLIFVIA